MSAPLTAEGLGSQGFEGFHTIGQIHRESAMGVPDACGIYVVLVRGEAPHTFRPQSSAPSWRGMDPAVPVEELAERWVEGAALLYVARARGPGVRHRLRQRVKRFLRFGHGKVVGHWGGRAIWQIREASRLVIAWRVCAGPDETLALERQLLDDFEAMHGRPPFAHQPGETPDDEPGADTDD